MVTITIVKMLKLLKIWKIDKDIKIKYTSLTLCDALLSESRLLMVKASLVLVVQLSHFYTRNWQSENE